MNFLFKIITFELQLTKSYSLIRQKTGGPAGPRRYSFFDWLNEMAGMGQWPHRFRQQRECKVVGVLIFILFLVQSSLIFSAQDDGDFVRGNHFFATGHYAQACDAYQKIEHKGFAVLYNLGLAY